MSRPSPNPLRPTGEGARALTPTLSRPTGEGARRAGEGTPEGGTIELAGRPKRVVVEFEGLSLRTHPDDMVYLCQLAGYESAERPVYVRQAEYADLPMDV